MLTEITDGVWVHESGFMQSNAVVVHGAGGVLLVDPGVVRDELAALAADLRASGRGVAVGFATHPHWDHLLWHPEFGTAPRYGTAIGASVIQARLADPEWRSFVARMIPPEIADDVPLDDQFGRIVGLSGESGRIPWDGPAAKVIEHSAHAPGHAALLIEDRGVLVAGDMLSDVLVPILNAMSADPIADYLAALQQIDAAAGNAGLVVPGHGSVGGVGSLRERVDNDVAYLEALRDGGEFTDDRIGPDAKPGWEWVRGLHASQLQRVRGS